ncbi:DUF1349 domain-containing protein [Paenibacillus rigui]|uniref:DUF1349 domain-containing protein n=1 Tax=Paenibacillus rigui TaxID=554312 RepID=A0A229URR5_9BACL|nr:DUF1349 domain-containing protein [Paenibacillus rigui]OXM85599.1 hypothetical protein CF651_14530 [Paenibacillus rigui]
MNLFDRCSGNSLSAELSWIHEPNRWTFDEDKGLLVSAPENADYFIDPAGTQVKASAPFLFTKVQGDFNISTRVHVEMKHQYDSGCLMIMSDSQNWAKLCYEFFEGRKSILSVVTKNTSDDCIGGDLDIVNPFLRIARSGNSFAFHYSLDGLRWHLIRYFGMECGAELKVGVVAQSPIGEGCQVSFEHLRLSNHNEGDIRSVK